MMMDKQKKILVLADVNRRLLEGSFPQFSFDYKGYADNYIVLAYDKLKAIVGDYEIIISEFDTIDKTILDYASKLKLLICCRGGIQTVVDVEYAKQRNIIVRNTPGRNAKAVAEYVIGQIIAADRFLYDYVESCQRITDSLGSYVIKAPDREDYYLIQAPEAYRIDILKS